MTIGERIQFYRKQQNLSQEQLGQMLFVSRQTVSLWEKNQTQPTIDNLLKLKEIFGVSVDKLLSGDEAPPALTEPAPEQEVSVQKAPVESFSVSYSKEDIRKSTMMLHKTRMTRMTISTVLLLILLILSLMKEDTITSGMTGGIFLFAAVLTVMNFLKLRGAIRAGEQQTMNSVYHYEIYENEIQQTVSKNGEVVATRRLFFSELTNIQQVGNLIVFQHANQIYILHKEDLNENSLFYWFLRSHTAAKKKPKKKGYLTAISVILFVLSIASLWIALIIAAVTSGTDPAAFYPNLSAALYFLPIPIGSIIFGVVTQRKGYAYKKNIVVGIIMAILLLIYGLFIGR